MCTSQFLQGFVPRNLTTHSQNLFNHLKDEINKNLDSASKKTQRFSITEIRRLILITEIIRVYSENLIYLFVV
jgi:hypothetical protein